MSSEPMVTAKTASRVLARVVMVDSGSAARLWEMDYGGILRVVAVDRLSDASRCDALIIGGRTREVPEYVRSLPDELRVRVIGSFTAEPATVSLAEVSGNVAFILRHRRSA
jgi:hypothetical protein